MEDELGELSAEVRGRQLRDETEGQQLDWRELAGFPNHLQTSGKVSKTLD